MLYECVYNKPKHQRYLRKYFFEDKCLHKCVRTGKLSLKSINFNTWEWENQYKLLTKFVDILQLI